MINRRERGSVVVLTAVLVPALICVVGLGVDFGIMYTVRNAAQNAADAAAMAGVYEYACGQNGGNCPALGQTYTTDSTGNTAAQHAFSANTFLGSSGATMNTSSPYGGCYGNACTPTCQDNATPSNSYYCYKVAVTSNSPTFFGKIFGRQSVPITVTAMAMANVGGSGDIGPQPSCVRPVFIPDSVIPCTYSGMGTLNCPAGPKTLTNMRPTSPQSCGSTGCTCGGSTCPSSTYYTLDFSSLLADVMDPANATGGTPNPVVFSDGSWVDNSGGGPNSPYADALTRCTVTALHCGQYVRVQTGVIPQTTDNSFNTLISETNSQTPYIFPLYDSVGQAPGPGNTWWVQVVGWAVMSNLHCVNPSTGATEPCGTTKGGVSDYVVATYQNYSACSAGGAGGGGASGSNVSMYDMPVRLVQAQ
jgi:Flp pilus assembly protein TadG